MRVLNFFGENCKISLSAFSLSHFFFFLRRPTPISCERSFFGDLDEIFTKSSSSCDLVHIVRLLKYIAVSWKSTGGGGGSMSCVRLSTHLSMRKHKTSIEPSRSKKFQHLVSIASCSK